MTTKTACIGKAQNRFGGDASAFGNAELRIRIARVFLVLPSEFGILGLADAGRVFLTGESSDTWHTAFGGGIWLAPVSTASTIHVAVARSDTKTGLYIGAGFAF